jgi:hypothetical protein
MKDCPYCGGGGQTIPPPMDLPWDASPSWCMACGGSGDVPDSYQGGAISLRSLGLIAPSGTVECRSCGRRVKYLAGRTWPCKGCGWAPDGPVRR